MFSASAHSDSGKPRSDYQKGWIGTLLEVVQHFAPTALLNIALGNHNSHGIGFKNFAGFLPRPASTMQPQPLKIASNLAWSGSAVPTTNADTTGVRSSALFILGFLPGTER